MRTKATVQLVVVILLCLLMFSLGRLSSSRNVVTYTVNGYPISFNLAWPTYGLPLIDDVSTLKMLRSGHSSEAIPHVEALLDMALYDAECRRPLLQGDDLKTLDFVLGKVARYRQQFPRPLDTSTNGFGNPIQLREYEKLIAEQKGVDTFLRSFVTTNAVKAQPQK